MQSPCGISQSKGLRAGSELLLDFTYFFLSVGCLGFGKEGKLFHVDKPAQNGKYSSLETRNL